jgi:hypothetical protein
MLKGMGVGAIIKLVLAIMIASLFISISTVGSIGQALSQSFEDIERVSGEKGVEIENAQDLGWVLTLTRDRASNRGCKIVEERNAEGGYPGLQGSYLTQTPPCYGGDAGLMRGIGGVANPGGLGADENFMPGIYSREKIEITRNFSFDHNDIAVSGSEDEYLGAPFQGDPRANADNIEINNEDGSVNIVATTIGSAAAGGTVGTFTAGPIGTVGGTLIGGTAGFLTALGNNFANNQPEMTRPMLFFEEGSIANRSSISVSDIQNAGDADDLPDIENQEFYLCEGDEGYVQANRGHLDEFGHSDKSPLIPMIVIDDIQYGTCDGGSSNVNAPADYGADQALPSFIPADWADIPSDRKHEFTNSGGNTYWWALEEVPEDIESGQTTSISMTVMSGDQDLDDNWRIEGKMKGPQDGNYNQLPEGWLDCSSDPRSCEFDGEIGPDQIDNCGTHKLRIRMDYQPNSYVQWWDDDTEFQDESDDLLQENFRFEVTGCDGSDDSGNQDPGDYGSNTVPSFLPESWSGVPKERKHEFTNSGGNTYWWAITEYPEGGTIQTSDPENEELNFKIETATKDEDFGDGDWRIIATVKTPSGSDYEQQPKGWKTCEDSSDFCSYSIEKDDLTEYGEYKIEVTMDYMPNSYYHYWNSETDFQDEDSSPLQDSLIINVEN